MQTYLRLGHDSVLYDPFRNDAIIFGGLSAYPYLRHLPHANYLAYCPVSCRETRVPKTKTQSTTTGHHCSSPPRFWRMQSSFQYIPTIIPAYHDVSKTPPQWKRRLAETLPSGQVQTLRTHHCWPLSYSFRDTWGDEKAALKLAERRHRGNNKAVDMVRWTSSIDVKRSRTTKTAGVILTSSSCSTIPTTNPLEVDVSYCFITCRGIGSGSIADFTECYNTNPVAIHVRSNQVMVQSINMFYHIRFLCRENDVVCSQQLHAGLVMFLIQ